MSRRYQACRLQHGQGLATCLREVLDGAAREDEGHIGTQAEQRVELLGLVHSGDLAEANSPWLLSAVQTQVAK